MKINLIYLFVCLYILSACGSSKYKHKDTVNSELTVTTTSKPEDSEYSCGNKQFCSEMDTCDEAKYYYEACNSNSLDRDNDGIPCESLCL